MHVVHFSEHKMRETCIGKYMSKIIQILSAFLLIFSQIQSLHAAPLKTLSIDFTREITENGKKERIEGTLHYDVEKLRVVIDVKKPIKQLMVAMENKLEIYYPDQKQAFRFISEGPVPLPLVETIIQSTQAEYGLTALGYTLNKHDIVDEILYTYWNPPGKAKEKLGTVILGIQNERLISAEVKNPQEIIIVRTLYQKHKKIGTTYIPMQVTASNYGEKSEVTRLEKIIFSKPQANSEKPNPILTFTIPSSVKVREIKW